MAEVSFLTDFKKKREDSQFDWCDWNRLFLKWSSFIKFNFPSTEILLSYEKLTVFKLCIDSSTFAYGALRPNEMTRADKFCGIWPLYLHCIEPGTFPRKDALSNEVEFGFAKSADEGAVLFHM